MQLKPFKYYNDVYKIYTNVVYIYMSRTLGPPYICFLHLYLNYKYMRGDMGWVGGVGMALTTLECICLFTEYYSLMYLCRGGQVKMFAFSIIYLTYMSRH